MHNFIRNFITAMEDIRRLKKISIHDFIDGVTSERSYYRYVKNESEPSFSLIVTLLEKNALNYMDIVNFMYGEQQVPFSFEDFYLNTFCDRLEAAKNYEVDIRKANFPVEILNSIFNITIKMYEMKTNKITKAEYQSFLKDQMPLFLNVENTHLYKVFFLSEYLEHFPQQVEFELDAIIQSCMDHPVYGMNIQIYTLSVHKLIQNILKHDLLDHDFLQSFVDHYFDVAHYYSDYNYVKYSYLDKALLNKLSNNDHWKTNLMQYISYQKILLSDEEFLQETRKLSQLFAIDINDFYEKNGNNYGTIKGD